MTGTGSRARPALALLGAVALALAAATGARAAQEGTARGTTIAMIGAGDMGQALGEAIYSARLFEGTRFIRAFNLKAAFSFPDPDEVAQADYDMPWTTNDPTVRPIAEALIRAAGGTPVYEGGLENAREY